MNLSNFGNKIKSIADRLIQILKVIFKLPYIKTYLIVSIPLIIIFLIFTFPYDVLLRNQLLKLEQSIFKSIYIRDIQTSFVDVTTLTSIHIITKEESEISINDITVNMSVNPYTLMINNNIIGDIAINGLKFIMKNMQFNFNVNGNANIKMDKNFNTIEKGKIKFFVQNCNLKLNEINIPTQLGNLPVKIPDIKNATLNFDSNIINKILKIENMIITGPDVKGSITGTVTITNFVLNSTLDLLANIDAQSKILNEFRDLLGSYTDKDGKIKFRIKGTLNNPRIEPSGAADSLEKQPVISESNPKKNEKSEQNLSSENIQKQTVTSERNIIKNENTEKTKVSDGTDEEPLRSRRGNRKKVRSQNPED